MTLSRGFLLAINSRFKFFQKMTTQIEIPIFDTTGDVVDYIPIEVQFPICVKFSNFLYKQYKLMDEKACYEFTKFRDGQCQLYRVEHTKANESVEETTKLLGFRHWRFGFQKIEFDQCELKEMLEDTKEFGLSFFALLEIVTP